MNADGVRPVCGLSDAPEIPAQFRGKYARSLSTCKNPGDGRLEILATAIRFYESRGRMLVDFFRRRPDRHPIAWGWAVTLGMYLGALAYFWFVWRPRSNSEPG